MGGGGGHEENFAIRKTKASSVVITDKFAPVI